MTLIGERIKEVRKSKGMTQKELGAHLGVSASMINQYEKGKRNPKLNTISMIALALGVHADELIGDALEGGSGKTGKMNHSMKYTNGILHIRTEQPITPESIYFNGRLIWWKDMDMSLRGAYEKGKEVGACINEENMHAKTTGGLISRQAVIAEFACCELTPDGGIDVNYALDFIKALPSAEQEKEIPRRVIWSGWKGTRYTRYKCPNCNKPVKNDDVYCHRCGQKLMFPHIDWTPYVKGQKQELIVRWDDE